MSNVSVLSVDSLTQFAVKHLHGEALVPSSRKAALLIVHGIGEHGGRYRHAMRHLAARNIACFVYDQRGHGRSPGPRGDVEQFALLVDDLKMIVADVRQENPGLPLFLWGHSMGSIVTILAAAGLLNELRGVLTSGCPIDVFAGSMRWVMPPLRLLSRATPRLRLSHIFKSANLSHDVEVQRAYDEDPLVAHSVTLRLVAGIGTASKEACAAAPHLTLPWLAVHGAEDRIAPPRGSEHLVELLKSTDKRLVIYAGLRHEVHNEVEPARAQVLDTLAHWIIDRRTH